MNEYIECPKCKGTRLAMKGSAMDGGGYRLRLLCQNDKCLTHVHLTVVHNSRTHLTKVEVQAQ